MRGRSKWGSKPAPPTFLYGLIAGLVLLSGGLAFALWKAEQTETVTFEFAGERVSVETDSRR